MGFITPTLGSPLRQARQQVARDARDFGGRGEEGEDDAWLHRVQASRMVSRASPARRDAEMGDLQAQVADVTGSVEALRQQVVLLASAQQLPREDSLSGRGGAESDSESDGKGREEDRTWTPAAASMAALDIDPVSLLLRAVAARDLLDVRALAGAGGVPGGAACTAESAGELYYGVSPLALACFLGDRPAVRLLLDAGADNVLSAYPMSRRPVLDSSPLGVAMREGHFHLVWDLVNAGADADGATAAGQRYGPQVREMLKTLPQPDDGWRPRASREAERPPAPSPPLKASPRLSMTSLPVQSSPKPSPRLSMTSLPVQSSPKPSPRLSMTSLPVQSASSPKPTPPPLRSPKPSPRLSMTSLPVQSGWFPASPEKAKTPKEVEDPSARKAVIEKPKEVEDPSARKAIIEKPKEVEDPSAKKAIFETPKEVEDPSAKKAIFETPRHAPAPEPVAPFTASERALLSAAGLRNLNMRR